MKISNVTLDALAWLTIPSIAVSWVYAFTPLWLLMPPIALISLVVLGLIALVAVLKHVLPIDSPAWLWGYRLLLAGCGCAIAVWRLFL